MPPPDASGPIIPIDTQDEETRAAAEVFEMLQKQQLTANLPKSSSLLTLPGEADYFEGGGLMETIQQHQRRQKMCSAPVSQPPTPNTPAGLISTITVGIFSLASAGRRLDKSYPKRGITQLTPDGFKVCQQTDYK